MPPRKYPKKYTQTTETIQTQSQQQVKVTQPHYNLNNIIELTEEHETKRLDIENEDLSQLLNKTQKSFWEKSLNCLLFIFPCFKKENQLSIHVKKEEMMERIEKLKTDNLLQYKPVLPPLVGDRKTLVIDLDQVLVFSSQDEFENYDFSFMMKYKKYDVEVFSKNRFGLESFLFEMSQIYELVVYTTNLKEYAEEVLKNIDKKGRVSHVIFKENCVAINKTHYLKSMRFLGRDETKVIFLDHNLAGGILQPKNFLEITPYVGQPHDRELLKIIPFLRELSKKKSVVSVPKNYEEYCNREIRLKFNSIDRSMQENEKENEIDTDNEVYNRYMEMMMSKKKKYSHKKSDSEVESLTTNESKQEEGAAHDNSSAHENTETEMTLKIRDPNIKESL